MCTLLFMNAYTVNPMKEIFLGHDHVAGAAASISTYSCGSTLATNRSYVGALNLTEYYSNSRNALQEWFDHSLARNTSSTVAI